MIIFLKKFINLNKCILLENDGLVYTKKNKSRCIRKKFSIIAAQEKTLYTTLIGFHNNSVDLNNGKKCVPYLMKGNYT